jgi:hypothetical protein
MPVYVKILLVVAVLAIAIWRFVRLYRAGKINNPTSPGCSPGDSGKDYNGDAGQTDIT